MEILKFVFASASASASIGRSDWINAKHYYNEKNFIHEFYALKEPHFPSSIDWSIGKVRILCIYTIHMSCGVKLKKTITTIVGNSMLWAIIILSY